MSIQNSKTVRILCHGCGKTISGARTVIDGHWHCADCTYLHDYPHANVMPVERTRRAVRVPQKETLFDPGPPRRKDEYR